MKSNKYQNNFENNVSELEKETSANSTRKLQVVSVLLFGVILLIFLAFSFFGDKEPDKNLNEQKKDQVGTSIKQKDFTFNEDIDKIVKLIGEQKEQIPSYIKQNNPMAYIAQATTQEESKEKYVKPKIYKNSSSIVVKIKNEKSSKISIDGGNLVDVGDPKYNYLVDENGGITKKLKSNISDGSLDGSENSKEDNGEVYSPKVAHISKFDPNLLLSKGTYIGCSLNTRLVSSIKGNISCTVSEDVYSVNGTTLLIEKGSKISGFFKSGQTSDESDRIYVIWQEIRTPNHVVIPVYSGATDNLGGSGIQGYVDNHWIKRFGSAILLSIIDDTVNVAFNGGTGNRGNNNKDYTSSTRATAQEMAAIALKKFINIKPTLYKNHGDIVGVYVNRDIDFSKVYRLKRESNGLK